MHHNMHNNNINNINNNNEDFYNTSTTNYSEHDALHNDVHVHK